MGFRLSKSVKVGPFRLNASKSGIGISTGIPGFRIGMGPRGNYISAGKNGVYYRKSIKTESKNNLPADTDLKPETTILREIESVETLKLVDSDAKELLSELNTKLQKPKFAPIITILIIISSLGLLLFVDVWLAISVALVGGLIAFFVYQWDEIRTSAVLLFEIEEPLTIAYDNLHKEFESLAGSKKTWHLEAQGDIKNIHEQKRHSGASTLISREQNKIQFNPPKRIKTNISVPTIPVGLQTLCFFPDRLYVIEGKKIGAVAYKKLGTKITPYNMIETQELPTDAQVIDYTWKHPNKSGGPDKRFKENYKIPICQYTCIFFESANGLNEAILVSKPDTGEILLETISQLSNELSSN